MKIVLIIADAMRADHMSCMGYERDTTPELDTMASKGILFKRAYSEFSFTGPSIAALLTSSIAHGVRNHKMVPKEEMTLLSEVIDTYLVTGCALFDTEGWRRGFKRIEVMLYRDCCEMTERLLSCMEGIRDGLFMVHFLDTHVPYDAGSYRGEFDVESYPQKELSMAESPYGIHKNLLRKFEYRFEVSKEQMRNLGFHMAQYDGAIRSIDSQAERIRSCLAAEDILIFLADHGELFGEHEFYCNHPENLFYDELLHVPLLMYGELPFRPTIVPEKVSLLDVAPTICDMFDVSVPETFEGSSLLPLFREAYIDPRVLERLRKLGYCV